MEKIKRWKESKKGGWGKKNGERRVRKENGGKTKVETGKETKDEGGDKWRDDTERQ